MPLNALWPQPATNWSFDVGSLIVLIGEDQELKYRLSGRSLLHCVSAAPVIGLQNYLRSYDLLLQPGVLTYYSPYGCITAPLFNYRLENSIARDRLLEDSKYTVYLIPTSSDTVKRRINDHYGFLLIWIAGTWLYLGGVIVFVLLAPETTWIGLANILVLTAWSILARLIEHYNVIPTPIDLSTVTDPDSPDAVFILGRNNSAIVLEGSRKQIKDWTSRGLAYKTRTLSRTIITQTFTRLGSLLVLLFIFSTVPNGHTLDQLGFIMMTALGQINVLIGQWLGSKIYLSSLTVLGETQVASRTHLYALLLRRFQEINKVNNWVEVLDMLPKTKEWHEWKSLILNGDMRDPKQLFNEIYQNRKRVPAEVPFPDLPSSPPRGHPGCPQTMETRRDRSES